MEMRKANRIIDVPKDKINQYKILGYIPIVEVLADLAKDETPLIFSCPHCKNKYKEQRYLDEHIKKKHPDKVD